MTTETVASPEPAKKARAGGFAALVAAGILLSRVAGLIRERVFAHYLGTSSAADAFKAALKIPNILQNLFGEGVLSASFIPVYAKLLSEKDERLAGRVAGVFASILALAISLLVLIGIAITPFIIDLIAPGFTGDVRVLTIRIVRILFPGVGLLVLSAWCLGVLNSHNKFFLSYVAPVLWNIAIIATLAVFGTRLRQNDLAIAVSWGTVVGSALQFGIQLPFVFRYAHHLSFGLDRFLEPVREIFRNLGPVLVGRGVVQVSAYIDQVLASYLPAGAVSGLAYAQTIYLLPVSLFGMSVAAAELPHMSRATGDVAEIHEALRRRLERGLRQIAFFVIPTIVAFVLIGRVLVAALYETGDFGPQEVIYVWYILVGSTLGLLATTLGRLYSSAFYALRDTRTPLWFAVARVILTGVLGYLFAFPLRFLLIDLVRIVRMPLPTLTGGLGVLGTVGLTASAGVAGWLEFLLLRRALQKKIGRIAFPISFQVRLWVSAVAAGLLSLAADLLLVRRLTARLPLHNISEAVVVCGVFGVVYFAVAIITRVPEAQATIGRFVRRR